MACHVTLMYQQHSTPMFAFDDPWPPETPYFGFSATRLLEPDVIVPDSARQTDKKKIHDIFSMPGVNAVSQRFRDLVEEYDSGIHQFFPLALRRKDDTPIEMPYYVFNCGRRLEALLVARSNLRWIIRQHTGEPYVERDTRKEWVLSRPAIDGHHIWSGTDVTGGLVFFSDDFLSELNARKIRYLEQQSCRELDEPWIAAENIEPLLDWRLAQGAG
jgi:hypothetical protein